MLPQGFSAAPQPLRSCHLGAFPLDDLTKRVVSQAKPNGWEPTGCSRSLYLDMAETIVRTMAEGQDETGAIVDCVLKQEWGQTTPRFASPGAYLLSQGRIPDLRGQVELAMTSCCVRLADGQAPAPDFWMRELCSAYHAFSHQNTDQALMERWAKELRRVNPEALYTQVRPDGNNLEELHNWTVYAAGGEALREACGLVSPDSAPISGMVFCDKYLPTQLLHFTEYGMYRDPQDPITYDLTTRLQFAVALLAGYRGTVAGDIQELLRRGAITQLFYISPLGLVPYGGRSSQFQFQEAIVCALCELEARRHVSDNPLLAGAFKRQGHLSALAIRPWIMESNPFRHVRNHFPIEKNWGGDIYANHSCYGLTAASFLALAADYANDSIPESPCPAELGGFTLHLDDAFHKVFATGAGYHVEIDTKADLHYDATGLGRVHHAGLPFLLGLHAPFTKTPLYKLPEEFLPKANMSLSSTWKVGNTEYRLADLSHDLGCALEVTESRPEAVQFQLHYRWQDHCIDESYRLSEAGIRFTSAVTYRGLPVEALSVTVPVPITDGEQTTEIIEEGGAGIVCWRWGKGIMTIEFDKSSVRAQLENTRYANRNGIFCSLIFHTQEAKLDLMLSLTCAVENSHARSKDL